MYIVSKKMKNYICLFPRTLIFCYEYLNGVNLVLALQIQRLGGVDSDFAPFVQHAGVPSIDIYYGRGKSKIPLKSVSLGQSLKSNKNVGPTIKCKNEEWTVEQLYNVCISYQLPQDVK